MGDSDQIFAECSDAIKSIKEERGGKRGKQRASKCTDIVPLTIKHDSNVIPSASGLKLNVFPSIIVSCTFKIKDQSRNYSFMIASNYAYRKDMS